MKKYLHKNLKVDNLPLNDINTLYHEFFHRKDYEWWYEFQESDVVVDIGACVGFFTCLALDGNVSKIYAVEPNKDHLKTLVENAFDYYIDNGNIPVVPVHAAIGTSREHIESIFGNYEGFSLMSFKYFLEKYDISWIDYLKVDCEGGEYDIFREINMDFLLNNVKHIAAEFHVRTLQQVQDWIYFRDNLLGKFDLNKVRFIEHDEREIAFDDKYLNDMSKTKRSFMLYITN